ncbi:MAG: hypothetical protein AAF612_11245 [Planctomycetota bacterium]
MKAPARLQSRGAQQAVIAVAMAVVMLGVVFVASAVTGAGFTRPGVARLQNQQAFGVQVGVPERWVRDEAQEQEQQKRVRGEVRVWRDPARPSRAMLLRPFVIPPLPDAANAEPVRTAQNAAQEYVRRHLQTEFLNEPQVNVELASNRTPPQVRAWVWTLSQAGPDGRPRLDAIALVGPSQGPGRFWVLHMLDLLEGDPQRQARQLAQNAYLLERIVNEATFSQEPA